MRGGEREMVNETDRWGPPKSEVGRLLASKAKAQRLRGWAPAYGGVDGFRRGLESTIEWFSDPENLAVYKEDLYNR